MDHDQRFKAMIKEFFREFLMLFFPQWVLRFDFTELEWLDKEVFFDPPDGERGVLDLLAKVKTTQPVHIEGEGDVEHWMALVHIEINGPDSVAGLRRKFHAYYEATRKEYQLPVLPIGLLLKVGLDGIGVDVYEERFWELTPLRFEYCYVGLPKLEARDYLNHDVLLGAALAALMRVSPEDRARLRADAQLRIAKSNESPKRKFLLNDCVEAYLPLAEEQQEREYHELLSSNEYEEIKMIAETTYDKGFGQGVGQGELNMLVRMLEGKFGPLSETEKQKARELLVMPPKTLTDRFLSASDKKDLGLVD